MANVTKTIVFNELPKTLDDLKKLPGGSTLTDEFEVAALIVAALCRFPEDKDASIEMLDYLNGPNEISAYDKQFWKERFEGKPYKARSYFEGATPENNYTPNKPYTINVRENPYSRDGGENYCKLMLKSGGADSERSVTLRQKPSTGQWFMNGEALLADIRVPKSEDPWA